MLTLKMAFRNLWRNKRRTGLIILAMVVALSMLMLAIGILNGMMADIIASATDQYTGHIQITKEGYPDDRDLYKSMKEDQQYIKQLEAISGVVAASARLRCFGLLSAGNRTQAIEVLGVLPEEEKKVTTLSQKIIKGTFQVGPGECAIGQILAQKLGVDLNSQLVFLTSAADGSIGNDFLKVKGIFKTGSFDHDGTLALVKLPWLQDLLVYPGQIHEIALRVKNPAQSPLVSQKIPPKLSNTPLLIRPWQEILPAMKQILDFYDIYLIVLLSIFYLATGLGIINSFFMIVYERTKEFSMMLSLGTTPGEIRRLMLAEAFFMGLISVVIGGSLGFGLLSWFYFHGLDLSAWMTPITYLGATIPPVLHTQFSYQGIIYPILFLLGTSAAAAYIPAWRASRLDPVKGMRRG